MRAMAAEPANFKKRRLFVLVSGTVLVAIVAIQSRYFLACAIAVAVGGVVAGFSWRYRRPK